MQVVWVVAPEGRARSGEEKVAMREPGVGKGVVVWRERWWGLEGEWWIWRWGGRFGGIVIIVVMGWGAVVVVVCWRREVLRWFEPWRGPVRGRVEVVVFIVWQVERGMGWWRWVSYISVEIG